ncbi:MAG: hypothetical protein RR403_04015 [Pseudoflavonifractor sp.]
MSGILGGLDRRDLGGGRSLRLLSALELLQARREAEDLMEGAAEQALCANACLLARALEQDGSAVFESGQAALMGLTAAEIGRLAGAWAALDRGENPSPEDGEESVLPLKKAWSTRLMSACNGACSKLLGRCPRRNGSKK